jgi:hypothetical protein
MSATDDATIEASRKWQDEVPLSAWHAAASGLRESHRALIDIATRRGEENKRINAEAQDYAEDLAYREAECMSERDALAEQNKTLRDQLKEVAEALCDCDSHMRDGHHYGDCPLGTAQIDALAALSGGTE